MGAKYMTRWLNKLLFLFSVIGLIFSIYFNLLSNFAINVSATSSHVFILHGLAFFLLAYFILNFNRYNLKFDNFIKEIPLWIKLCCAIVFAYSIINVVFSSAATEFGSPDIWNGRYVLQNKGTFIRDITETEYLSLVNYEFKIFTSVWIATFCSLAVGYWQLDQPKDLRVG